MSDDDRPGADAPTPSATSMPAALTARRWPKGVSGNPSGRAPGAKGLAKLIARETANGRELVERLLEISRGKGKESLTATLALLDRFAGKPIQAVDQRALVAHTIVPTVPPEWDSWSRVERERYLDELVAGALPVADDDEASDPDLAGEETP